MGVDGCPRTTRRLWEPTRVLGTAVALAAVLATGGCPLGEPGSSAITITNESSVEVNVFVNEVTEPQTYVRPGGERYMVTVGDEGNCIEWLLTARTAEGTDVSTFGPPVCDKDEWVITQEDLGVLGRQVGDSRVFGAAPTAEW